MGYRILVLFLCFILLNTAVPLRTATLSGYGGTAARSPGDWDESEVSPAALDQNAGKESPQTTPAPRSVPPLDRHSEEIRNKVLQLGTSSRITVKMKNHQEFYGTVTCVKSDYFEVEDVDQKRIVTIKYEDVQKVHEGFGGKNAFTGRRVHPHGRLIGLLVVGGLLITLIVIAVTQRD